MAKIAKMAKMARLTNNALFLYKTQLIQLYYWGIKAIPGEKLPMILAIHDGQDLLSRAAGFVSPPAPPVFPFIRLPQAWKLVKLHDRKYS